MIFFAAKEKTEDLLYQAMSFMEKKQPKTAIPLFKKIVKQDHLYVLKVRHPSYENSKNSRDAKIFF